MEVDMYKLKYRFLKGVGVRQKNITRDDLAVCLKRKFFFIHVPKTAGKSIRLSLFGQENGARHCSASYLKKCYPGQWNSFFTFCFVRNPYDRLYSAYRYLRSGGNRQDSDLRFCAKQMCNINDFEQFVCSWLSRDSIYGYTHFIPQYEFIYQRRDCLVDYVGRFENLQNEYQFLCDRLGLTDALAHVNCSVAVNKTALSHVYSTEMARKVKQIYADDFRLLGYSANLD